MRVIAGKYKGIPLQTPTGLQTRPTLDRVKEALFSILQFDLVGRVVLDLFAGSGALGIEALSRGAAHCHFVDHNRKAIEVIRSNLSKCKAEDNFTLTHASAEEYLTNQNDVYDIIFLDPPYKEANYLSWIERLQQHQRLAKDAIIVIECHRKDEPVFVHEFEGKTYHYGDKSLIVLKRKIG